jgi:hypothetical protein
MNRFLRSFGFFGLLSLVVAVPGTALAQRGPAGMRPGNHARMPRGMMAAHPLPMASPPKEVVKTASGEQFFIVASVDQQNSQLLLKRPTEVTVLVKITPQTKYLSNKGKPVPLATFHSGDTVWAKIADETKDPTLLEMRHGEMTLADLHRYYLDYPIIK